MEDISQDNHPARMKSYQKDLEEHANFYKILEKRKRIICIGIEMFSLIFWLKLTLTFAI